MPVDQEYSKNAKELDSNMAFPLYVELISSTEIDPEKQEYENTNKTGIMFGACELQPFHGSKTVYL